MAAGDGHSDLYQQLVIDASLTLSDFFELKRPLLLSASDDEKEAAFSELVELTCRFPNDFLSDQQVGLLLDFFLGAFESSTVTAPYAVRGIHHLDLLRTLSASSRSHFGTFIIDVLSGPPSNAIEMSVRDSDFVLTFIRAVGGERHPRCLPQVFRMFVIVARSFPIDFWSFPWNYHLVMDSAGETHSHILSSTVAIVKFLSFRGELESL
ncbi:unnamed protein product [Heligmosomoides polygyrus]|uniref:MMS19 nucleotide excision repair protein n=1 Tax=Heligmosomoides polygyrus TaxID=6339 RepID=A0A3P7TAI2_HELPZ|nr:unnamed protein product [Heligmosomoides polygyrus]